VAAHGHDRRRQLLLPQAAREGQAVVAPRQPEVHDDDVEAHDRRPLQGFGGRRRRDAAESDAGQREDVEIARVRMIVDDEDDSLVGLGHGGRSVA
jgi:hypothetical protein